MKTRSLYLIATTITLMSILYACKKDNNNNSGTSSTDLQTQSDDQTTVSNENDAVVDDVNAMLISQPTVTGSSTQPGVKYGVVTNGTKPIENPGICNASTTLTVDSVAGKDTLTITYNGANCTGDRTRTGTVAIVWAIGSHWKDKGAVVTVSIQNLKITRVRDNKSITLNGTHTYTNVSGGSFADLYTGQIQSITHSVTSDDMSITFDNGAKRTWHVARQRVYTYANQNVVITTTGLHTDGNNVGISEWGTNRLGNAFVTQITQALVLDQGCSWRLTQGEVKVIRPEVTTTITFGLDASGNPTSCPGEGTYYFKLVWEAGKTYTFILPY